MAYTTGTLTYIAGGPIEGAWKLWEYTTIDTLAQLTAAGYITDATFKGMSLGDFVIVVNQTNPQGYILQVQSLTAGTMSVSGTATLAERWDVEIIDWDKLDLEILRPFLRYEEVMGALRGILRSRLEEVKGGKFSVRGARFFATTKAQFR